MHINQTHNQVTCMPNLNDFSFIPDNGEMATLIRQKDWSKTPLGPPANWDNNLKNLLAAVLHSKFPMFIFWGPELICFYNDAYRPSLGNKGKHPTILGSPGKEAWTEIWPIIYPLIEQVMAGGPATWSEDQLIPIYRNGTVEDVYWTFSYSRINNDNGEGYGVYVTCVETTEKVLNKKKLEETAELLKFSTEAAELGTWDYNPSTGQFTANERLKSWFGQPKHESIDLETAIRLIKDADRERVSTALNDTLDPQLRKPYEIQYSITNSETGMERIVMARGKAYFDENNIPYRLSGIVEDVTERETAHRTLEEAEERARLAIAAGNMGTFDFDIKSSKAITSDRCLEVFDVDPHPAHEDLLSRIHPDDKHIREEAIQMALEKGYLRYEVRVVHRDGSIHWVRVDGRTVTDADGNPVRMLGVINDITSEKEFELKREEYIAIASHELKNPMTSLKLSLDVVSGVISDPVASRLLTKSQEHLRKLISLSNELLNVSKIAGGVLDIKPEIFNMESAIRDSIATIDARESGIIEIKGSPDFSVYADRFRIEQVMVNLLSNAIKYSPRDSAVQISASRNGNSIKVEVRDKGIGIDHANLSRVFQKFSRIDAVKGVEGHGLGLYISNQIIRRHGGTMGVVSEKGRGSTFWFTLPQ